MEFNWSLSCFLDIENKMKVDTSVLVTSMMLEKVGEVFNNRNINAVMECFAPDAIFDHASGSEAYITRF